MCVEMACGERSVVLGESVRAAMHAESVRSCLLVTLVCDYDLGRYEKDLQLRILQRLTAVNVHFLSFFVCTQSLF